MAKFCNFSFNIIEPNDFAKNINQFFDIALLVLVVISEVKVKLIFKLNVTSIDHYWFIDLNKQPHCGETFKHGGNGFYLSISNRPILPYPYFDLHLHQLNLRTINQDRWVRAPRYTLREWNPGWCTCMVEVGIIQYRHYRYRLIRYRHVHPYFRLPRAMYR